MKRRVIIKFGVFLVLGAVANVAVAWGLVLWPGWKNPTAFLRSTTPSDASLAWWQASAPTGMDRPRWMTTETATGFDCLSLDGQGVEARQPMQLGFLSSTSAFARAGFPCRALYTEWFAMPNEAAIDWNIEVRWGMRAQVLDSLFPDRKYAYLPLLPIWPGFAINTFFYATILWLLFAAPGRVRRWRRIRRGLCAKCAYPVGASEVCTECGAAINKNKVKARGSTRLPPLGAPAPGTRSGSERSS